MIEKVHSIEPLQYVLTQLADLTDDEKNTLLLVNAAKGWVKMYMCNLCVQMKYGMSPYRDELYRPLLGVFHRNDKYSKHQVNTSCVTCTECYPNYM